MTDYNSEVLTALWHFIDWMDSYLWIIKAIAAGLVFLMMLMTPWKVSRWILAFRYLSMVGMLFIFFSWGNSALGPIGDLIFWPSFVVYKGGTLWAQMPAIIADIKAQPSTPERIIFDFAKQAVASIVTGTPMTTPASIASKASSPPRA